MTEPERTAKVVSRVDLLVMFMESLPDASDFLHFDDGEWWATNEFICGGFCGRAFTDKTKEGAVAKLIGYFDAHVNHESMVGKSVTDSGWPNLESVCCGM
jgi:hypothetical protein